MSWSLSRRQGDGKYANARICVNILRRRQRPPLLNPIWRYSNTLRTFGRNCHAFRMWENCLPGIFTMAHIFSLNIPLAAGDADENRYRPEKIVFMLQLNYQFSLTLFDSAARVWCGSVLFRNFSCLDKKKWVSVGAGQRTRTGKIFSLVHIMNKSSHNSDETIFVRECERCPSVCVCEFRALLSLPPHIRAGWLLLLSFSFRMPTRRMNSSFEKTKPAIGVFGSMTMCVWPLLSQWQRMRVRLQCTATTWSRRLLPHLDVNKLR